MHRAMLAAMMLFVAGCSDAPTDPIPAIGPLDGEWREPQHLDWWRYEVEGAQEPLTLVFDALQQRFVVAEQEHARWLAAQRIPLTAGHMEAGSWNGSFEIGVTPPETRDVRVEWIPWPPVVTMDDERRSAGPDGQTVTTVTAVDAETGVVHLAYEGAIGGSAVYSVDAGWMTELDLHHPRPMHWTLRDHGQAHQGETWLIEHRGEADILLSLFSSYAFDPRGAKVVWSEYTLDCAAPGAIDLRLADTTPAADPFLWYQDACPDTVFRQEVHERPDLGRPRLEFTVASGDMDLDVGRMRLVFLREQAEG